MWLFYSIFSSVILAVVNILDSTLIHKYEKDPFVVMWAAGLFRLPILLCFPFFISVKTDFLVLLFGIGIMLYFCSLLYLYILRHIDTSVTQSAWAIESIFLSVFGFIFFAELLTYIEMMGAVLILSSVFILSYWHRHVSIPRTIGLLTGLALVGAPVEMGLKYAVELGVPYPVVLFWYLFVSGLFCIIVPLGRQKTRNHIKRLLTTAPYSFYLCFFIEIILSLLGFATAIKAFTLGPLSLITIANNIQIFLVVIFAWLLTKTKTTHIPKELLTRQSVKVKLTCFSLAFIGLALLGIST